MSASFVEVTTGDGGGGDVVGVGSGKDRKNKTFQENERSTVVKGSVGWMNRAEVRKRVYAGMTPGQKRAKHIITGKEIDMEGRQWVWDYWNNYKAASVFLSMFGIVLCLVSTIFMLSAKGAFIEGRTEYWTWCDWTEKIQCSPIWTSTYAYAFGLVSPAPPPPPPPTSPILEDVVEEGFLSSYSTRDFIRLPNDMYLIIFYVTQIILSEKRGPKFVKYQLALSGVAAALTLWMAHAIVFVLDLWACPMALIQFGVNCGLALSNVTRWRALKRLEVSKKA